jgi:hypothetical protein
MDDRLKPMFSPKKWLKIAVLVLNTACFAKNGSITANANVEQ